MSEGRRRLNPSSCRQLEVNTVRFSEHPLWFAGFRAFFALACLSGMVLPLLWSLVFQGSVALPAGRLNPMQWHAHEMFYGFGWAVMGGFLLTATKNWVRVRGYHGTALALLAAAWLAERAALWFAGDLPAPLFAVGSNLFLATIVAMLMATLLRHRDTDVYRRDNLFFLVMLPTFLVAKNLMLSEAGYAIGVSLTLGLFRLAILVMLERTLTEFMRNVFKVEILRDPRLDRAIKLLALAFAFESLLPRGLAAGIALLLAALLVFRLFFWHPHRALRRIDIGIMFAGYLALVGQLLLEALAVLAPVAWVGNVSVHLFALGGMGLIIPAMLIRICNGHTGRKVVFTGLDKSVLWIMLAALAIRVVVPQLVPEAYLRWIDITAACWLVAFGLLAWRYIPYLVRARVDGREH